MISVDKTPSDTLAFQINDIPPAGDSKWIPNLAEESEFDKIDLP